MSFATLGVREPRHFFLDQMTKRPLDSVILPEHGHEEVLDQEEPTPKQTKRKPRRPSTDFLVSTHAKRARRCLSDGHTLPGLLPELRQQIWDALEEWSDLAAVARVCKRLAIELRKHSLFVPRNWWPKNMRLHNGVRHKWFPSRDAQRLWIQVVQCAKANGLQHLPPRLKAEVICYDTLDFIHARLAWKTAEAGVGQWYLSVEHSISYPIGGTEPWEYPCETSACLFKPGAFRGIDQPVESVIAKLKELAAA